MPREIEADAALRRDHVAFEARAGAERRHRHAALARDREDARDLLRRGRVDDEVRPLRPVEGHVGRVQVALGVAVRDARVLAERVDERLAELLDGDAHAELRFRRQAARDAVDRPAQAVLGRALGGEPVVRLAVREERRVAAERLLEPLRGREHDPVVPLGAPVEPLDLLDEAAPAARPVAGAVELPAEREVGVDVLVGRGSLELAQRLPHARELARPDGFRAEPSRQTLQPEPRRVDLLEVLARQPADEGAPGRADGDEAFALEPAEARPHRGLRDAEPRRELPLHELRALGQLAGDDQRAQRLRDPLLDRLPLLERLDRLVGKLELHGVRTSRSARRPRAAASRRERRRGSRSPSQPSPRPRRERSPRSRRARRRLRPRRRPPSRPARSRTCPTEIGSCVASSSQRKVESSGVTWAQKTGKPSSTMKLDVPAAAVEHATRDAARRERGHGELAEMRGDVLAARVHGDVAGRNLAEHLQHLAQRRCRTRRSRLGLPRTVNAGPASFIPRSSGRIEGGRVCVRYPRVSRMSASAAV